MDINEIKKFEDEFRGGVYAVPGEYKIKVRALYEYCKKNNLSPNDLSKEQLEKFVEKRS
ncbi:hypothetical protein [Alkalihalobacterium bogoriense]|uniref:hypothetical protein n=1 Tax=Alkalihalobacterium bogoriense TaxID=246272 RepID=UPI000A8BF13D|nr:hypothetical protein [Alkalihalobacterium bogoriense]